MTRLIFKNANLQGILRITLQATIFNATFDEAVDAYQKATGKKYTFTEHLEGYFHHNIPSLHLVKDHGIYLMTAAKLDNYPADKSHICYAEGFAPDTPGWYQKCMDAFGGDDSVDGFPFNQKLQQAIKQGVDIHIRLGCTRFSAEAVIPKQR